MYRIEERYHCWAIIDADSGNHIAFVDIEGWADGGSITSRGCTPEDLADRAALFAAAPDMLRALKMAEEELEFDATHGAAPDGPRVVDQALRVVKAAITKATTRPKRSENRCFPK